MQFFPLDTLADGESVNLICSMINPDRDRTGWRDFSPVKVTRQGDGLTMEWAGGFDHVTADLDKVNPFHQAMQEFCKRRGGSYFYEFLPASDLIRQHYRARRSEAIRVARRDLKHRDKLLGAEYARTRCPWTAAECLAAARADLAAGLRRYNGSSIWKGLGGRDGSTFAAYGEKAMRWIENPESKGLRFVGKVGDLDRNRGEWYTDEFQCETVAGVVYQLPTAAGELRFLAGYADPFNSDKQGRGPACLSAQVIRVKIEEPGKRYEYDSRGKVRFSWYADRQACVDSAREEALREAIETADHIAERYAEAEREYQESHRMGREARQKAGEMLAAGREWLDKLRLIKSAFRARHKAGLIGQPIDSWRDMIRAAVTAARDLRETYQEARDSWIEARETAHGWQCANSDAWAEGYAEGAE